MQISKAELREIVELFDAINDYIEITGVDRETLSDEMLHAITEFCDQRLEGREIN